MRRAINSSPRAASENASSTVEVPAGRTKPSVNSDEPLVITASEKGLIPAAQYIMVYPPPTRRTQVVASESRASGP